jgi:tetratricopeptide (TPR) repeat protein
MRLGRLAPAIVFAATLLLAAPSRAQEQVKIDTGAHEGYGRIVFAWPVPVEYEAHLEGKLLTVKFARPLAADLERITKRLGNYVEAVAMDGDATVIVTLKRAASLRRLPAGNRIALDLVDAPVKDGAARPAETAAAPAPQPAPQPAPAASQPAEPASAAAVPAPTKPTAAEPAKAAAEPPEVIATVSDHDGARRIAFEWPKRVGYASSSEKGKAKIRFKQSGRLDAAALAAALPELAPEVGEDKGELVVQLTLPAGSRYRTTQSGRQVFVDVTMPAPRAAKAAPVPLPPAAAAVTPPSFTAEPPAPPANDLATTPTSNPAGTVAAPAAAAPPPAGPAERKAESPAAAVAEAAPSPAEAVAASLPRDPAPSLRDPAPLPARYGNSDEGATLRFEWKSPVTAAVFRRGPYLWIVFGAPLAVDLADLRSKGKAAITAISQVPHGTATILRVTALKGFNPSIRRADNAWVVELTPQFLQPDAPIGVSVQPSATPPRLFFGVREPGEPVVFRDPEVGDTLIVVPVGEVGQGVAREERLIDVTALLTVQGVALRPVDDTVVARARPNGVEVTRPAGLRLSGEGDRALKRSEQQPKLFDFADWYGPKSADFNAQRRALQQGIVAAAPISRSGARLDLARFYFAHGYGAEALGVLEAIQRDDPGFASDMRIRALAGGAMLLAGDIEGAGRELSRHALDDEPDVGLWRGSLDVALHDWPAAAREFTRGVALLPSYPKLLRNRIALEAAEAAITTGQHEEATRYLGMVLKDAPSAGERAGAQLLSARALQLAGESEKARGLFDKLAQSEDRPTRARAVMARTLADLDAGAITRGQAIEALDGLRFAWRGDDFELGLLRRLGELKFQDGDYRGGLDGLRQSMANFDEHPEHNAIAQQLSSTFSELFIGSQAENVPPLRALALYDEFRELTPAGAKGDEIIQKLADRLVSVDLLDRAAALLEDQVKFRLKDRDKARVATRLALVRLLDRKPQAALATLNIDVGKLDGDLLRQRQQLRARALLELGKPDEALAILANDTSRDADRLRADIAWRTKNWAEAARVFTRLAPPVEAGKLDDDGARAVLNWVTALTLADDNGGTAALVAKYGEAMGASAYRDAFRVLSGTTTAADGDIRQLAGKVAQVGDLQSFMAGYKQRLAGGKLSTIN